METAAEREVYNQGKDAAQRMETMQPLNHLLDTIEEKVEDEITREEKMIKSNQWEIPKCQNKGSHNNDRRHNGTIFLLQ